MSNPLKGPWPPPEQKTDYRLHVTVDISPAVWWVLLAFLVLVGLFSAK